MSKKLLLIGAGGHCHSVIETLLELNEYDEIGIIDKDNLGSMIMGIAVIGCDDDLLDLYKKGYDYAFISIGNIKVRKRIYNKLKTIGYNIPIITDRTSIISKTADIQEGVYIGKGSIVNVNSKIGICSIINTGAIIEHDCTIGDFVNIAPRVVMGGGVNVCQNSNVGLNTSIRECVSIGENSVIGMGSVVTKDVADNILAYGNPCRKVSEL